MKSYLLQGHLVLPFLFPDEPRQRGLQQEIMIDPSETDIAKDWSEDDEEFWLDGYSTDEDEEPETADQKEKDKKEIKIPPKRPPRQKKPATQPSSFQTKVQPGTSSFVLVFSLSPAFFSFSFSDFF